MHDPFPDKTDEDLRKRMEFLNMCRRNPPTQEAEWSYNGEIRDIMYTLDQRAKKAQRVWTEAEVEQLIYTIKRKLPFENWDKITAIVKEAQGPEPIE